MGKCVGVVGSLFAAGMVLYAVREFRKLDQILKEPPAPVLPAPRQDDPRADNDFVPASPARAPWTLDDKAFEITVTFPGRAARVVDAAAPHSWGYDGPKKARYEFSATPRGRAAADELAVESERAVDRMGKRGYVLTDRRDVAVGRLTGYELTFATDHPKGGRTRREWGVRGATHFYRIEAEADPKAFQAGAAAEFFDSVEYRPRATK